MINKRLFNQFNREEVVLVVSGYPEKISNGDTTHGISWYTKRTLEAQSDKYGSKFVVLAEKGKDNKPRLVENDKILVLRIFDKKHPSLFPQILKWLKIFNKNKKVIVHSEFCADGGARNFLLLLPFLTLIKIFGKKIVFFSHNVVENFDEIAPHLNLKKGSLKLKLFNWGIKIYNRGLGLIVDQIVVLDPAIKERICKFVNPNKVFYTPIWVEKAKKTVSQEMACKQLGLRQNEKIILYFGFVSWYKGADWLVQNFAKYQAQNKDVKIRLVIAGGPAYSLKQKAYYQNFYQKLENLVNNNSQITLTGFVRDSHIPLYFQAADLVIFPYRGLIGASGGLNHALQYNKPFMVSNLMQRALGNTVIEELTFCHTKKGMAKIIEIVKSEAKLDKLRIFSKNKASKLEMKQNIENEYNKIYGSKYISEENKKVNSISGIFTNLAKADK